MKGCSICVGTEKEFCVQIVMADLRNFEHLFRERRRMKATSHCSQQIAVYKQAIEKRETPIVDSIVPVKRRMSMVVCLKRQAWKKLGSSNTRTWQGASIKK